MWNFLYSALIFTFCWADERGIKGPWQGEWGLIPPGVKCWYISNLGKTEVGGSVGESEAGHLERATSLIVWWIVCFYHKQNASLKCARMEKSMAVMEGGWRGPGYSGGLWRLGAQNSCLQHGSGMNGGLTLPASSNRYVLSLSLLYWIQPKSSSREERGDDGGESGEREEEWEGGGMKGRGDETKPWAVSTPGAGAKCTNKPGYCPDLPFWTACGYLQQTAFLWE